MDAALKSNPDYCSFMNKREIRSDGFCSATGSKGHGGLQLWILSVDLTPRFWPWIGVSTDQWPAGLTEAVERASLFPQKTGGDSVMDSGALLFCCRSWPKDLRHWASVALPHLWFPSHHQTREPHWPHPHTAPSLFHVSLLLPVSCRNHVVICLGVVVQAEELSVG